MADRRWLRTGIPVAEGAFHGRGLHPASSRFAVLPGATPGFFIGRWGEDALVVSWRVPGAD